MAVWGGSGMHVGMISYIRCMQLRVQHAAFGNGHGAPHDDPAAPCRPRSPPPELHPRCVQERRRVPCAGEAAPLVGLGATADRPRHARVADSDLDLKRAGVHKGAEVAGQYAGAGGGDCPPAAASQGGGPHHRAARRQHLAVRPCGAQRALLLEEHPRERWQGLPGQAGPFAKEEHGNGRWELAGMAPR